jgi:hypothetical protein
MKCTLEVYHHIHTGDNYGGCRTAFITTACIDATVTINERKGYTRPSAITVNKYLEELFPIRGDVP